MKWQKPDGRIMDCQDNEATEKECLRLGFKKIESDAPEVGEPEEEIDTPFETVEISEADMPSQGHDPYNPADPDPSEEPEKEEQSISPDDVGEMPKDILGG